MKKVDFEQIIRKLIPGKHYGELVSKLSGIGIEKNDVRPYYIGDEAKNINRKVSAKQQDLFVNTFRLEKDSLLQVFFDVNANWSAGYTKKLGDIVVEYYVDLLIYCLKSGVYVECFFPQNDTLVARSVGKDRIKGYKFIQDLHYCIESFKATRYISRLSEFILRMKETSKQRNILIFSDFLELDHDLVSRLNIVDKDYGVYLFRLPISHISGKNYDSWYTKSDRLSGLKGRIIDASVLIDVSDTLI